jgi:hypothetical protein
MCLGLDMYKIMEVLSKLELLIAKKKKVCLLENLLWQLSLSFWGC